MKYLLLFLLIGLLLQIGSCQAKSNKMHIEYYKTWKGYNHPIELIDKIEAQDTQALNTYYEAIFEDKLLVTVRKFSNNKIIYEYEYKYDKSGKFIDYEIVKAK